MKRAYFLLLTLVTSTTINGMKHTRTPETTTIRSLNNSLSFISLPDDIHLHIFSYITPISNWQNNYLNLSTIAKTAAALQQTCKTLNQLFPVRIIAKLMKINNINKNILLINSAEKGIPGLVQYAINKKANLDYINKKDGRTPLSVATQEKNYKCCLYLLNAGADVNMPFSTSYPIAYKPIEIATRNGFFNITQLLLKFKANSNEECSFCPNTLLEHLLAGTLRSTFQYAPIVKLLIDNGAIISEKHKEKAEEMLTTLL